MSGEFLRLLYDSKNPVVGYIQKCGYCGHFAYYDENYQDRMGSMIITCERCHFTTPDYPCPKHKLNLRPLIPDPDSYITTQYMCPLCKTKYNIKTREDVEHILHEKMISIWLRRIIKFLFSIVGTILLFIVLYTGYLVFVVKYFSSNPIADFLPWLPRTIETTPGLVIFFVMLVLFSICVYVMHKTWLIRAYPDAKLTGLLFIVIFLGITFAYK